MIKTETKTIYLVDVINEIQKEIDNAKLPVKVKVDFGEALEDADIGLAVYINGKRNWKIHDEINSIIQDVLEKYDLIPFIDWRYKEWVMKFCITQ